MDNNLMGINPMLNVAQQGPVTFTQEQVNNIVASRVNSLNAKINELSSQIATLTATNQNYVSELNTYREDAVLNKNNVPDAYRDFVRFSAQNLVNSDVNKQKTFEVAVSEFMATNKALFSNSATINQPTVQNTPNVQPTVQGATPVQQVNGVVAQGANMQGTGVVAQQGISNPTPMAVANVNPVNVATQPVVNNATPMTVANINPVPNIAGQPLISNVGTVPAVAVPQQAVNNVDSMVTAFLQSKGFK